MVLVIPDLTGKRQGSPIEQIKTSNTRNNSVKELKTEDLFGIIFK